MPALFSSRIPDPLSRNKLAHAHERLVSGGASVVDLTTSNPTLAGFQYPKAMLDALGSAHGLSYRPDLLGLRSARDGVAAYLRELGLDVDGRHVVLTVSTSDAYFRLELLCDTYLSVAMPVQLAVEGLLSEGAGVTTQIAERVRRNYQHLERLVATYPAVGLLPVEGGWYAVVQVPATASEETLVLDLLKQEHILVHPGYFFDFPREAFLVMSLLPETVTFESATERVLSHLTSRLSIPS